MRYFFVANSLALLSRVTARTFTVRDLASRHCFRLMSGKGLQCLSFHNLVRAVFSQPLVVVLNFCYQAGGITLYAYVYTKLSFEGLSRCLRTSTLLPTFLTMQLGKPDYIMAPQPTKSIVLSSRWEAGAYTAVSFTVPDNWKAGRIWVLILPTSSTCRLYHNNRAGETAILVPTLVQIPVWMVGVTEDFSVILIQEL